VSSSSPPRAGVGWGAVLALVVLALVLGAGAALGALLLTRGDPPAATPSASEGDGAGSTADARASADPEAGYAVWARDGEGRPVRWDPCRPIHLVVSSVGAPDSYPAPALRADVEEAAERLAATSGLAIVVEAGVDEVPDADRSTLAPADGAGERWAPVLVGWREPGAGGLPLRDVDRGIAVPVAVGSDEDRTYVTGQVALNPRREDLRPGFDDRATSWGATVLHELAHVLGLDHVDDPDELMYVYPGEGPVELGPGDRAGLRALGAAGGCVEVPAPRELDVEVPAS
jgi:hypothetical protein